MAETSISSAQTPEQWDAEYFEEYIRDSQFSGEMGTDENSIIQLKEQLSGREKGDTIHYQLVRKLTGAGVTGDSTLEGNEEGLDTYQDSVSIDWIRHAVKHSKRTEKFSPIELRNASKAMLKVWSMENMRDDIIARLMTPNVNGTTTFANTANGDRDTWLTNNYDRALFGKEWSNSSSLDFSTSFDAIDNTNDKFTPTALEKMRLRAKTAAQGKIRPIMVDKKGELFVVYAHSNAFRDFSQHSTFVNSNYYASERGKGNPLFVDGDLIWKNCVIKEVPEMPAYGDNTGSVNVVPVILCGAQALALAWGQRTKSVTNDLDDYGFRWGCAIEELRGIKKCVFDNIQHGVLNGFFAGEDDA